MVALELISGTHLSGLQMCTNLIPVIYISLIPIQLYLLFSFVLLLLYIFHLNVLQI